MDYMSFANFYICAYYNHTSHVNQICKNALVAAAAELTGGVANAELTEGGINSRFSKLTPNYWLTIERSFSILIMRILQKIDFSLNKLKPMQLYNIEC
jgi:hypothetical protein